MTDVRGCNIPEELYYWVEKHVWVRDDGDDVLTLGITDPAQHLAARVVAVTTKKVGKTLERGQSVATIESGKWVGPVPTPVNGEVIAVNEALAGEPTLVNTDPYGRAGSCGSRRPSGRSSAPRCTPAPHAVEEYRAFLEAEGISCG